MVTRRGAIAAVAALTATLIALSVARGDTHPLHTTLTEVTVSPGSGEIRAMVRLFVDDLAGATRGKERSDAEVSAYVAARLGLVATGGEPIPMRACGVKRTGDLVWVCLGASGATASLGMRNTILAEVYADQVNVVRVEIGVTRRSLLFTRGDGTKTIR